MFSFIDFIYVNLVKPHELEYATLFVQYNPQMVTPPISAYFLYVISLFFIAFFYYRSGKFLFRINFFLSISLNDSIVSDGLRFIKIIILRKLVIKKFFVILINFVQF